MEATVKNTYTMTQPQSQCWRYGLAKNSYLIYSMVSNILTEAIPQEDWLRKDIVKHVMDICSA